MLRNAPSLSLALPRARKTFNMSFKSTYFLNKERELHILRILRASAAFAHRQWRIFSGIHIDISLYLFPRVRYVYHNASHQNQLCIDMHLPSCNQLPFVASIVNGFIGNAMDAACKVAPRVRTQRLGSVDTIPNRHGKIHRAT